MLKKTLNRSFCVLLAIFTALMSFHWDAVAAKKSQMQLLFIVNANKATITPQANQVYHITMDAGKVYYFSQRPSHSVGLISFPAFLEHWNKNSKDSFYTDHPNAALTGVPSENTSQQVNLIFEMKNSHYDAKAGTFSFDMKLLRGEMRATQLTEATLFIDTIPTGNDYNFGGYNLL